MRRRGLLVLVLRVPLLLLLLLLRRMHHLRLLRLLLLTKRLRLLVHLLLRHLRRYLVTVRLDRTAIQHVPLFIARTEHSTMNTPEPKI